MHLGFSVITFSFKDRLAFKAIQASLDTAYEIFHNKLARISGSGDLRFNFAQALPSPRVCTGTEDIYPGPRCLSGIHELISMSWVKDPVSSKLRKAYRVHVKGRLFDDWVWANDLELDTRYAQMVACFEDSMSFCGKRIQPLKWVGQKLSHFKQSWYVSRFYPSPARLHILTLRRRTFMGYHQPKPAILKQIYIDQEQQIMLFC